MMRKLIYATVLAAVLTNVTGCKSADDGSQTAASKETGTDSETSTGALPETTVGETKTDDEKIQLAQVYDAVKKAYGDAYIPSMEYDEQFFGDTFGITNDMYDSYIAEGPMISAHVDTFVAVEAKEGKGGEVEKLLKKYREEQVSSTLQYPSNIAKINASEVIRHGDDVYFVMLGAPSMESEEQGEEAALESAKENNKIGIDAINQFYGI